MWELGALTLGTAVLQPCWIGALACCPEVLHTPVHAALMQALKNSQGHDDVRTGKLPAHQKFSPDVSQLKYERSEGVVKGLSGWLVAHGLHLDDDVVLQGVRELVASKHDLLVLVQLPAHVRDTSVLFVKHSYPLQTRFILIDISAESSDFGIIDQPALQCQQGTG
jgi:hypothetical protein